VRPCIAAEIGRYTITRRCRGAEYRIHVVNSGQGRAPRLTVDGKLVDGDLVPYAKPGATVVVECEA
jgi:cellobiose phosphorylase